MMVRDVWQARQEGQISGLTSLQVKESQKKRSYVYIKEGEKKQGAPMSRTISSTACSDWMRRRYWAGQISGLDMGRLLYGMSCGSGWPVFSHCGRLGRRLGRRWGWELGRGVGRDLVAGAPAWRQRPGAGVNQHNRKPGQTWLDWFCFKGIGARGRGGGGGRGRSPALGGGARGEGRGARGEGRGARGVGRGARGEGRGARGEGRPAQPKT